MATSKSKTEHACAALAPIMHRYSYVLGEYRISYRPTRNTTSEGSRIYVKLMERVDIEHNEPSIFCGFINEGMILEIVSSTQDLYTWHIKVTGIFLHYSDSTPTTCPEEFKTPVVPSIVYITLQSVPMQGISPKGNVCVVDLNSGRQDCLIGRKDYNSLIKGSTIMGIWVYNPKYKKHMFYSLKFGS